MKDLGFILFYTFIGIGMICFIVCGIKGILK